MPRAGYNKILHAVEIIQPFPNRDLGVWPESLEITLDEREPKLFIVNLQDVTGQERLEELYPTGTWSHYNSKTGLAEKDFLIYFIPVQESH